YGERWGRHWMDVWRYSDWAGYKDAIRTSQPHIWRWRDWIVESLNADKPYDRMVLEMLAADELVPEDEDALRATGYLVRSYDVGSRDVWLDNVVSHAAQGFLGITMGCVKCHDHKYDPIPNETYYAMRAIFEGYDVRTDRVPGELDTKTAGLVRAYDKAMDPKTFQFDRGDERFPLKDKVIAPGVPTVLGGELKIEPVTLPMTASQPWRRDFVRRELLANGEKAIANAKSEPQKAAAVAAQAALEAEFAVEAIEEAGKTKDSPEWKAAAEATVRAQRKAASLDAQSKIAAATAAQSKAEADFAAAKAKKDTAKQGAATKALTTAKTDLAAAKKALAAAE
ncbi:MAG: DUF1549 domain-containing protein, partial [Verrucomicrobiae bacterium]|nr:DUF1549 domain-containing protein [Verrucomicrobiae bacterium]